MRAQVIMFTVLVGCSDAGFDFSALTVDEDANGDSGSSNEVGFPSETDSRPKEVQSDTGPSIDSSETDSSRNDDSAISDLGVAGDGGVEVVCASPPEGGGTCISSGACDPSIPCCHGCDLSTCRCK